MVGMVALIALIVVVVALLLAAWGLRRRSADEVHSVDGYRHALHTLEDMRRGGNTSVRVLPDPDTPAEEPAREEESDTREALSESESGSAHRSSAQGSRIGLVRPIHEDLGSRGADGQAPAPDQEEQFVSARHAANSSAGDPPRGSGLAGAGDALGRLEANGHVEVEVRDVLAPSQPAASPAGPEGADPMVEGLPSSPGGPSEGDETDEEGLRGNGTIPAFGPGGVESASWRAGDGDAGWGGDEGSLPGALENGTGNGLLPGVNGHLAAEEAPAPEGHGATNGAGAAGAFSDPFADEGEILGLVGTNSARPGEASGAGEVGTTILPSEGSKAPGASPGEGDDNPTRLVFDDFRPPPTNREPYDAEAAPPPRRDRAVARMNHRPRRFLVPVTAIVVALVAVGAVIVYAVTSKPSGAPSAGHATTTAHSATTAPPAGTKAPSTGATRSGQSSRSRTPRTTPTTAPLAAVPGTATASQASYSVPSGTYHVTLSVPTGACWVQVTSSATGAVLFTGTLQAGQSQVVPASGATSIDLGAPHSMAMSVNGAGVTFPTGYATPFTVNFQPAS